MDKPCPTIPFRGRGPKRAPHGGLWAGGVRAGGGLESQALAAGAGVGWRGRSPGVESGLRGGGLLGGQPPVARALQLLWREVGDNPLPLYSCVFHAGSL